VKVGCYAVTHKPDNHVHGLEAGKTYYYQLFPTVGLVLGNFRLGWSDEKSFHKASCRVVEREFAPQAREVAAAAAPAAAAPAAAAPGVAPKTGATAKLMIMRKTGIMFAFCHTAIDINGKSMPGHAELKNKEVWAVTVPAEAVTVQMHKIGAVGEVLEPVIEQRVDASDGKTHYFELVIPTTMKMILHPALAVSSEEAFKKAKKPLEFDITK
jgi:hypothetical protein